jgi:hypothetical protein
MANNLTCRTLLARTTNCTAHANSLSLAGTNASIALALLTTLSELIQCVLPALQAIGKWLINSTQLGFNDPHLVAHGTKILHPLLTDFLEAHPLQGRQPKPASPSSQHHWSIHHLRYLLPASWLASLTK